MIRINEHLALLGHQVEDVVTGRRGIVASITFDLYGCIQAIVNPGLDKDGKQIDLVWFDVSRLKVLSVHPVMTPPSYDFSPERVAAGLKGPSEKPAPPAV